MLGTKSILVGMRRRINENVMARYKKALLAIVAASLIGSTWTASATPASARDVGPVIAGALGGFAAGAIIGSTIGRGGYYPTYSGGYYYPGYEYYAPVYARSCYSEHRAIYDAWGDFVGYRHVRVCD
jgi:hypothetical protein